MEANVVAETLAYAACWLLAFASGVSRECLSWRDRELWDIVAIGLCSGFFALACVLLLVHLGYGVNPVGLSASLFLGGGGPEVRKALTAAFLRNLVRQISGPSEDSQKPNPH